MVPGAISFFLPCFQPQVSTTLPWNMCSFVPQNETWLPLPWNRFSPHCACFLLIFHFYFGCSAVSICLKLWFEFGSMAPLQDTAQIPMSSVSQDQAGDLCAPLGDVPASAVPRTSPAQAHCSDCSQGVTASISLTSALGIWPSDACHFPAEYLLAVSPPILGLGGI